MRIIHRFLLIVVIAVLTFASCDFFEADHVSPMITMTYPQDGVTIGENGVEVLADATDDEGIVRIEFYVDGVRDTLADDFTEPYSWIWTPPSDPQEFGKKVLLYAKAFDARENEMISNFVNVINQWYLLHEDRDEELDVDLYRIFCRSTTSRIDFRIETHDAWMSIEDSTGLHCAVFMDVDQDKQTGYTSQAVADVAQRFLGSTEYTINDLGADYAALLGFEETGLFQWDSGNRQWEKVAEFSSCECISHTDVATFSFDLNLIGNPDAIDIRAANISHRPALRWDWTPAASASTYTVDGLLIER